MLTEIVYKPLIIKPQPFCGVISYFPTWLSSIKRISVTMVIMIDGESVKMIINHSSSEELINDAFNQFISFITGSSRNVTVHNDVNPIDANKFMHLIKYVYKMSIQISKKQVKFL